MLYLCVTKLDMRIPSKFKLMGQTITVEYNDKALNASNNLGRSTSMLNKIELCRQAPIHDVWYKLPTDSIEQTFMHEVVHQILSKLNVPEEVNDNETFVDTFAGLLHQFLTTQEFETKKK